MNESIMERGVRQLQSKAKLLRTVQQRQQEPSNRFIPKFPGSQLITTAVILEQVGDFGRVFDIQVKNQQGHSSSSSKTYALKCCVPPPPTRTSTPIASLSSPTSSTDDEMNHSSQSRIDRDERFENARKNLIYEAELLSQLAPHPNIITIRGMATKPYTATATTYTNTTFEVGDGFFFLMDRLGNETLKDRLDHWRHSNNDDLTNTSTSRKRMVSSSTRTKRDPMASSSSSSSSSSSNTNKQAVTKRVKEIAIGIVSGLQHLHRHGYVLRDIRPETIGFDSRGTPKLIELGSARDRATLLLLQTRNQLPEVVGRVPYIPPEMVRRNDQPGKRASRCRKGTITPASDVYSLGILLWELCTLEHFPFPQEDCPHLPMEQQYMEQVIRNQWRPSVSQIPIPAFQHLIVDCWDDDMHYRPDTSTILTVLRLETTKASSSSSSSSSRWDHLLRRKRNSNTNNDTSTKWLESTMTKPNRASHRRRSDGGNGWRIPFLSSTGSSCTTAATTSTTVATTSSGHYKNSKTTQPPVITVDKADRTLIAATNTDLSSEGEYAEDQDHEPWRQ